MAIFSCGCSTDLCFDCMVPFLICVSADVCQENNNFCLICIYPTVVQTWVFIVGRSFFYMCICLGILRNDKKLGHLHIQDDCQNGWGLIFCKHSIGLSFHRKVLISSYVYLLGYCKQNYNFTHLVTKMAELGTEQHTFEPA